MDAELQDAITTHLDSVVESQVIGARRAAGLDEIKAGIEKAVDLESGEISWDNEATQALISALDRHPLLTRAAIGRDAHLWRFGRNVPPRSREIGCR